MKPPWPASSSGRLNDGDSRPPSTSTHPEKKKKKLLLADTWFYRDGAFIVFLAICDIHDFVSLLIAWHLDKPVVLHTGPGGCKYNVVLRCRSSPPSFQAVVQLRAFLQKNSLEQATGVMCIIGVQLGQREFWLAMFRYYKYLRRLHSCCRDPVSAFSVAMANAHVRQKQFLAGIWIHSSTGHLKNIAVCL